MSRSNGPASQAGGWPPAARPPAVDQEPQTRSPRQGHIVPPSAQGQAYATDPRYAADPRQGQHYANFDDVPTTGGPARPGAGYGQQPSLDPADPYAAPAYPPRQPAASQASAYAPQFDPYLQPQAYPSQAPSYPPQPPAYDNRTATPARPVYPPDPGLSQLNTARSRPAAPERQPPPPSYPTEAYPTEAYPTEAYPTDAYPTEARARGYDQWQAPATGVDPHGFDLGGYHPEARGGEGGYPAPAAEPTFAPPQGQRYAQEPGFQTGYGFDANAPAPRYGEPQPSFGSASQDFEPQLGLDPHAGYDPRQAQGHYGDVTQPGYDQALAEGQEVAPYEHEEEEYEEEPPRRSRMLYAVGALVVAVVVGGGLAFGYQKLFRSSGSHLATPVIKEKSGPAKIKPNDPGGKQFANRDSKMMDRLSSASSAGATGSTASAASDSDGGAKRVQTLVVTRDGSIAPPQATSDASGDDASRRSPPPSVSVPGLTIVDGFGSRPSPRPVAPVTAAAPPQPIVVSPPAAPAAKPVVVARAGAAASTAVDAEEPAAAAPSHAVKPAAAPRQRTPVPRKVAAVSPSSRTSTGAGYVAVLASVPASGTSRMDALKQFADMQQKYGSALQGKTPDVQEANLGEKGRYHRLLAGPPGSREQANSVCAHLKSAGFSGCWILSY